MSVGFVVRVTVALLRRRVPNAILEVFGVMVFWFGVGVDIGIKG